MERNMERTPSEDRIQENLRQAEIERGKAQERTGKDADLEKMTTTVVPGSDAPSRAGITPPGSGADST